MDCVCPTNAKDKTVLASKCQTKVFPQLFPKLFWQPCN